MKKGPQAYTGWKKRYIQLTNDKKLEYFTDDDLSQQKGTVYLADLSIYQIQKSSKSSDSKHFGFSINTPSRNFLFCVASSSERDDWIKKLRGVLETTPNPISATSSSINDENAFDQSANSMNTSGTASGWKTTNDTKRQQRTVRSKYQRRNQNQGVLTEEEAKQRIQELEERNDEILDEALMTSYETLDKAANTAETLSAQRQQLQNTDKMLHEIDQDLKQTDNILGGMKSWGGMIKKKFKKQKKADDYVAPVDTRSAFERRKKQERVDKYVNGNGFGNEQNGMESSMDPNKLGYEANKREDAKLDELLGNIKQMRQMGDDINVELDEQNQIIDAIGQKMDAVQPEMDKQNYTMHKLCN